MKIVDGIRWYKIGEVAKKLGKTPQTIKIWYEYAEENEVDLPQYRTDLDKKHSRYWNEESLEKLVEFSEQIKRGMLSTVTVKKWGKKGEDILERGSQYGLKRFDNEEVQE